MNLLAELRDLRIAHAKLQTDLALAKEGLEFYGEPSNWVFERTRSNESAITKEDISLPNKYKSSGSGGKKARETLAQLTKKDGK